MNIFVEDAITYENALILKTSVYFVQIEKKDSKDSAHE